MNRQDRAYLDSQARGAQQHLVQSVLSSVTCTWFTLDQTSAAGAPGDVVCLTGTNVTRAVAAALALAGGPCGILMAAAAPGAPVLVALMGLVPASITGLGATIAGRVYGRVNTTTARVEAVSTIGALDFALGTIESGGNLSLRIQLPPNTGGSFTAATDLAGSAVAQTVIGIQTKPVDSTAPTDDQSPRWSQAA